MVASAVQSGPSVLVPRDPLPCGVMWRRPRHTPEGAAVTEQSAPATPSSSPPPLTQPLARVATRAEDARPSRQRLATEDERHRVVGRELAGSDRVPLAMPAGADPAVDRDVRLHRPLRQSSPGRCPPHRMVWRLAEAVGEAHTTAAVAAPLVRRRPAAGSGVGFAVPTGTDAGSSHPRPSSLDDHGRSPVR